MGNYQASQKNQILKKSIQKKTLFLSNLRIQDVDVKVIVEEIKVGKVELSQILSIELFDNNIRGFAIKILMKQNFQKLNFLYLYNNNIGDQGTKYLAQSFLNSLVELNLYNNNITDKGAYQLSKGYFPQLRWLSLWTNHITNEGFKLLISSSFQNLETLNLWNNKIFFGEERSNELYQSLKNRKGEFISISL